MSDFGLDAVLVDRKGALIDTVGEVKGSFRVGQRTLLVKTPEQGEVRYDLSKLTQALDEFGGHLQIVPGGTVIEADRSDLRHLTNKALQSALTL